MQHPRSRNAALGFSLVEALTALAVAAILGAGAAPSMKAMLETRRLDGHARQLGADLLAARGEAMARNETVRVSLKNTPALACYLVHTGSADACSCTETAATCNGSRVFKAVRWNGAEGIATAGNVGSIAFDALHGTATPAGTLKVTAASDGRAVHHVVNVMGRLRSCTPRGDVPGFRTC